MSRYALQRSLGDGDWTTEANETSLAEVSRMYYTAIRRQHSASSVRWRIWDRELGRPSAPLRGMQSGVGRGGLDRLWWAGSGRK
jgi:hypothetical protein